MINEFTLQANFIIYNLVISKAGLRSAGDNDRRSKCLYSITVLCASFTGDR